MKLLPEWRAVLWRAWSVRFIVLAGLLSAIEVGLPIVNERWAVPPFLFLALSMATTAGACWARVVVQQGITPAAAPTGSKAQPEADRADQ